MSFRPFEKRLSIFTFPQPWLLMLLFLWAGGVWAWTKWTESSENLGFFAISLCLLILFFIRRGWLALRKPIYLLAAVLHGALLMFSTQAHDWAWFGGAASLFVFGYVILIQIERKLNRADTNPQVPWFSGLPEKNMARLTVEFKSSEEWVPAEIIRCDLEGIFVGTKGQLLKPGTYALKFSGFEQALEVEGNTKSRWLEPPYGMGLQFSFKDLYHKVEIQKLIQRAKGEGYL